MTPKIRLILYVAGVVASAALTILSATKVLDPASAGSLSAALSTILGLFGATASGTAAYNTNKQINNGTFDPAPEVSPADQVINGINEVLAHAQTAQSEVERVKDAVSNAVKDVPVLGPLAQQALDMLKLP